MAQFTTTSFTFMNNASTPAYISSEDMLNATGNYSVQNGTSLPSSEKDEGLPPILAIIPTLELVFPPITLTFGILGNILSFWVFSTKEFRYTLASVLYRMLAVADCCVILFYDGFHTVARTLTGVSLMFYHDATCKMLAFGYFYSRTFSAWMLVMIGMERFIGVLFPHRAKILCTKKRFLWAVTAVQLVLSSAYIPLLMSAAVKPLVPDQPQFGKACSMNGGWAAVDPYAQHVWPWVNLVLTCLLPFLVILMTNGGIIYGLVKASIARAKAVSSSSTAGPKLNSILATLFAVSFSFIILTIPYPVALYLYRTYDDEQSFNIAMFTLTLAPIFASINHSLNILMYCLCGKKFREALIALICWPCRRGRVPAAATSSKKTKSTNTKSK